MKTRHRWTAEDDALLRRLYPTTSSREIAPMIGVTQSAVQQRAKALRIRKPVVAIWTPELEARLRELYVDLSAADCADTLGLTLKQVESKAHQIGLRKSKAWIRDRARAVMQRPDHRGRATQFRPGAAAWNKGRQFDAGGRSADTRFQPGMRPHTWHPIGYTRTNPDGYLERKTADTGITRRDFVLVHHLIWRMHGQAVPAGHAIVFRDGDKQNLDVNNLESVTRVELMRRNSVHRLPKEVARLAQLVGVLNRKIRNFEETTA